MSIYCACVHSCGLHQSRPGWAVLRGGRCGRHHRRCVWARHDGCWRNRVCVCVCMGGCVCMHGCVCMAVWNGAFFFDGTEVWNLKIWWYTQKIFFVHFIHNVRTDSIGKDCARDEKFLSHPVSILFFSRNRAWFYVVAQLSSQSVCSTSVCMQTGCFHALKVFSRWQIVCMHTHSEFFGWKFACTGVSQ